MLAVILAGGFGTRLRPLTLTTPKPLLPVANKTLLDHTMDALPKEVDEVVIATGYKSEQLEDHFAFNPRQGVKVRVVTEDQPLGTGGAIRNAVEQAGGARGTFFVRNADLVDTLPLADMLSFHRQQKGLGTISLWEVEDPSPFGVASMEGPRITHFVEKPPKEKAPSKLVNAGTYLLEPEVLDMFPGDWTPKQGELSMERVVFPKIVESQRGMFGFPFVGHWIDCGRPSTYLEAHRALLDDGPTLGKGAECEGDVKGFACLGPKARVAAGASLEDSVLLQGARVEKGAVLVRSIVGVGANVGEGARLEDTVVGAGQEVPPGQRLKDARVPEAKA